MTSSTAVKVRLLGDRVLVENKQQETTDGGIHLPQNVQTRVNEGLVVAAGPGRLTPDGNVVPNSVKVGDKVRFDNSRSFELDGMEYLLVDERSVIAIL